MVVIVCSILCVHACVRVCGVTASSDCDVCVCGVVFDLHCVVVSAMYVCVCCVCVCACVRVREQCVNSMV